MKCFHRSANLLPQCIDNGLALVHLIYKVLKRQGGTVVIVRCPFLHKVQRGGNLTLVRCVASARTGKIKRRRRRKRKRKSKSKFRSRTSNSAWKTAKQWLICGIFIPECPQHIVYFVVVHVVRPREILDVVAVFERFVNMLVYAILIDSLYQSHVFLELIVEVDLFYCDPCESPRCDIWSTRIDDGYFFEHLDNLSSPRFGLLNLLL